MPVLVMFGRAGWMLVFTRICSILDIKPGTLKSVIPVASTSFSIFHVFGSIHGHLSQECYCPLQSEFWRL